MTTRRDDAALAQLDRVHALLAGVRTREVRMFGGIAVMVDDELAVSVHPDGDVLVRVDPDEDAALLAEPGVSRPVMGERSMGVGWVRVAAEVLRDDDDLRTWVGRATGYLARRRQG